MFLYLFAITPEEAFNRANILLNENKLDSVAYYLNIAYTKYPNEVENIIYLKYTEDKRVAERIAKEFIKINKKSLKISLIALNLLIEERNYNEIAKFLEFYPETTMVGKIVNFYKLVGERKYSSAVKIGDEILNLLLSQKLLTIFLHVETDSLDPINSLLKTFQSDYIDLACSNFYMEECIRQSSMTEDSKTREKVFNLIIYYGFFRLIYSADNFESSYKNLAKFTRYLIDNDCNDYGKLLTIFSAIYFQDESYDEYNKFLELVDTVAVYCLDKLSSKVKLLRAFGLRGLDRYGEALEILNSLMDSLDEPQKRFYVTVAIEHLDYKLARKLVGKFGIKDSSILNFIDTSKSCELLYNKRDFKSIFKNCSESSPERAYAYFLLSKRDSAIEIIKNLLSNLENSNRNYAYYWNRGWFELIIGNVDTSYYYTLKALQMRPNNSFLIMNIGSIYLSKSQIDSAIYYYKKAYETNIKSGNYEKNSFLQTLKNDIELISKIYNIPSSLISRIKKEIPY